MFSGHEGKFYYVLESVYGQTPETPTMYGVENVNQVDPTVDANNLKVRGIGTRDVTQLPRLIQNAAIKLAYTVPSDDVMQLLQYGLTCYPFTAEVLYEQPSWIISLRFPGSRVDKLTVEGSYEDVVKATMDIISQKCDPVEQSKLGSQYTDFGGAIASSTCKIEFGDADGSNLVTNEEVTDWKFMIENNLKRVGVIRNTNGHLLKLLVPRHRTITGEFVFNFGHRAELYDLTTDAGFSAKITIGAKYVFMKYCKWDNITLPTPAEDTVPQNATFTARSIEFEGVS